ncbi:conserved hypothetical protein [Enterobacterales bacterium 8AC]|nr:conserved hypothetical protein [Enterobacterales bacterium 8AC]
MLPLPEREGTDRVRWGGGAKANQEQRLHPLPEGEGTDRVRWGCSAEANQVRRLLPLPEGEGWGEGEIPNGEHNAN